jgi:outer membrane protein
MRFGLLSVLAFALASAQSDNRLTLESALKTALRQNPAVTAAQRHIEEATARVRQVRAGYFPQLGFNGIAKVGLSGATNELGLIGLPNSPFYRNFADSLNVSQRAYDAGRTKHRARLERFRLNAAGADLEAVEALVILRTNQAFYGLLRARRLREVAAEIVCSRELTVRQARAFYEGKIRSRVDLDLSRASLSQAQLELIESENAVMIAAAELGRALGSSQETDYILETPDMTPSQFEAPPHLVELADKARPELRPLRAQRDAASESARLARSRRKPFLSFAFSGGYARFTETLARRLLAGGVGLSLPIFTGGNLKGQIEEAEAHGRALDSRLEDLSQQVELEARRSHLRLQNALRSIPALKLQSEYSRRAVRLARERYRERLGTMVELNQAEAALAQAEAAEATGMYAIKLAEAELNFAIGRR